MIHAYDEMYIHDAQDNLGAMLEYAVNVCEVPLEEFYPRFLSSGAAQGFAMGHPYYVVGISGIELAILVMRQTGKVAPEKHPYLWIERTPEYWTGWMLAYLQWYFGMDFKALAQRGVDAAFLLQRYYPLHEADVSTTVGVVTPLLQAKRPSALKRMRKAAGLTQEALSSRSGVSLRMIRAYEQQAQSLEKAEYQTLVALARALGCREGDLVV